MAVERRPVHVHTRACKSITAVHIHAHVYKSITTVNTRARLQIHHTSTHMRACRSITRITHTRATRAYNSITAKYGAWYIPKARPGNAGGNVLWCNSSGQDVSALLAHDSGSGSLYQLYTNIGMHHEYTDSTPSVNQLYNSIKSAVHQQNIRTVHQQYTNSTLSVHLHYTS